MRSAKGESDAAAQNVRSVYGIVENVRSAVNQVGKGRSLGTLATLPVRNPPARAFALILAFSDDPMISPSSPRPF